MLMDGIHLSDHDSEMTNVKKKKTKQNQPPPPHKTEVNLSCVECCWLLSLGDCAVGSQCPLSWAYPPSS